MITILMFIPAYFTLAGCDVKYTSEKGDYILYNRGGLLSPPHVKLGVKSGLFITGVNYFSVGYEAISDDDWNIDNTTGSFELFAKYNNVNLIYVCATDSSLYHANRATINNRIDSLYYELYPKEIDYMDFVMPDDFSRIIYTDPSHISFYKVDDDRYPSMEIFFSHQDSKISPDSMIIRYKDSIVDKVYPEDSIRRMSPTEVQQFFRLSKGGKR